MISLQGLYPENHGIIDNWMYDKTTKDIFTLSGKAVTDGKWWSGEPVSNFNVHKSNNRHPI